MLGVLLLLAVLAGLATGSDGLSLAALRADLAAGQAGWIVGEIRAPRTLGAALVGALLGLAGALAQGLFRNPLADPYLLGAAAGASLGVVALLVSQSVGAPAVASASASAIASPSSTGLSLVEPAGWLHPGWWLQGGLAGAAFAGALAGVALTLVLAAGALDSLRLLLAGVVVGVLLGALADLLTVLWPQALRGRQAFLLGSTAHIGWHALVLPALGLALALGLAWRLARLLDALTLGDEAAASLGLPLATGRAALVAVLALCTGLAVALAGLVAFVGLLAPHLVRRLAPSTHGAHLLLSALAGAVLLLAADVLARAVMAPQELPVGIVTAVVGGGQLLWLLHRGGRR
jgi:iron complex transport system permease protein